MWLILSMWPRWLTPAILWMTNILFHNPFREETVSVSVSASDSDSVLASASNSACYALEIDFDSINCENEKKSYEIFLNGLGFIFSSISGVAAIIFATFFLLKSADFDSDAFFIGISFPFLTLFFFLAVLNKSYLSGNPNILKLSPAIASSTIRIWRYNLLFLDGTAATWVTCEIIFALCLFYFYFGGDKGSHVSRQILKPWIKRPIKSKYVRAFI